MAANRKKLIPAFLRLLAVCCTAQPCADGNAALGMHICAASNDGLDPVAHACRDAMLHPHHRLDELKAQHRPLRRNRERRK